MSTNSIEYTRAYQKKHRVRLLKRLRERYAKEVAYREKMKAAALLYKRANAEHRQRNRFDIKWKPVSYKGGRLEVCNIAGLCKYLGVTSTFVHRWISIGLIKNFIDYKGKKWFAKQYADGMREVLGPWRVRFNDDISLKKMNFMREGNKEEFKRIGIWR